MSSQRPRLRLEALEQLTEAMLTLTEIGSAPERAQLIALMDPAIGSAVPHATTARAHVANWIRTCAQFHTGRENLVAAVSIGVADTPARSRVLDLIDRLWPA